MYLKALELQGFKSFADKTTIHFDGNITAIVGPNGSGKSNISDAIRWVLGEQSTKTLRGSKMEDVIFGGTQKRAQVGYAEASLVFDNSDGALSYDSGEVMVTRRYFRSGESEYFINRQQARLRDVLELFMDTGIGKEGYSNIGQGKIDEILALKSTDRREVFEEAAGISKYRHRKEETERKLQATEENLLRIGDKISELELQIGPLKLQAEKAEKYLAFKEELSGTEIALWLDSLSKISSGSQKAEEEHLSATFILGQEKETEEKLYSKEDMLSADLLALDGKIENARTLLSEKKDVIQNMNANLLVLEKEIENRTENVRRILADVNSQRSISDSIQVQISDAQQAVVELDKGMKELEAEFGLLETQAQSARESGFSGKETLFDLQNRLAEISEAVTKNKSQKEHLTELLAEKSERAEHLKEECEKAKKKLSEIRELNDLAQERQRDERDKAEAAENSLNGYRIRASQAEEKIKNVRTEQQQLEVSYQTANGKLSILKAMERDMEGFHKPVKSVMHQAEIGALKGIHGPVASLLRSEPEYALAVETALSSSQQSIVVDTENSGKAAMLFLKSGSLGRATFLPLSVMKGNNLKESGLEECDGFVGIASELVSYDRRYQNVVMYLLGRTVIAEDIDYALSIARRFGNRFKIVTLDGQVLNPGGSMTGGSAAQGTGIISRKNEIDVLQKEIGGIKGKAEEKVQVMEQLNRKYSEAAYHIEIMQSELRMHEDELLKIEKEIENYSAIAETVSSALEEDTNELRQLDGVSEQLKSKEESLARESAQLILEKEKAESDYSELSMTVEKASEEARKFELELSTLRERFASLQSQKKSILDSIDNYHRIIGDMSRDKLQKEDVIERYRQEIVAYEKDKVALSQALGNGEKEAGQAELALQLLLKKRSDCDSERVIVSRSAREITQKIAVLESECYRLEQKRRSYESEEQSIIEKLWDNYSLTPSSAIDRASSIESVTAAQKKINDLKRKINALGTPNIGAIEEFNRLNERYSYLSSQKSDVESAKSELVSVLRSITKEMTTIFTCEFERINHYFSETFVEMFNGGNASLVLEDPDSPLDCGIEIKVQPPGKQLKTITLLSGGEKAFVAIALYFAILKVRPTPFCMLDEIDAALDDRNVERFSRYLRSLSRNTQFIVITHRRGTMEEADSLYGVTMQEQGISRMLHLNLDELSRQLGIEVE